MEENKKKELSYDELKNVAGQLSQQNQQLNMMLQQANMTNMFKRLDYLFEVLKYANTFNDDEFVGKCVAEIKEALTIVPSEEDEEEG